MEWTTGLEPATLTLARAGGVEPGSIDVSCGGSTGAAGVRSAVRVTMDGRHGRAIWHVDGTRPPMSFRLVVSHHFEPYQRHQAGGRY